jgi:hypothetical protein
MQHRGIPNPIPDAGTGNLYRLPLLSSALEIILNSNARYGFFKPAESERAVPCPDFERCLSAAKPSSGKAAAARSLVGLQALQPREGVNEDFIHLFTFSKFSILEF